jgi:hypothetical protein
MPVVKGSTRDRSLAGEFGAEHLPGEQIQEENDGEGEKAEDRHRLQNVEQRDQHHLGAPALGREGRIDEGEDDRADDGQQHPHGRSQRIDGKIARSERYRRDVECRQGKRGLLAAIDDQHHRADDESRGPDAGAPHRPGALADAVIE